MTLWAYLTFDASKIQGRSIPWHGSYSKFSPYGPEAQKLHADARRSLPRGLYYELRGKIPADGRDRAIAWVHEPGMWQQPKWQAGDCPNGSYIYFGGFVVP